jgi:hypothetical protein
MGIPELKMMSLLTFIHRDFKKSRLNGIPVGVYKLAASEVPQIFADFYLEGGGFWLPRPAFCILV